MRSQLVNALCLIIALHHCVGCRSVKTPSPEAAVAPVGVGGFIQQWEARLMLARNEPINHLYLRGDMLYAYTGQNAVYALSASGGQVLWTHHLGNAGDQILPPLAIEKGATVLAGISTLERISARGALEKTVTLEHSIRSPLSGTGHIVYCGLDYATGGRLAQIDLTKDVNNTLWELMTNKGVSAGPLLYQGIVFAAGENGNIYALNEARDVVWPLPGGIFQTERPITADLKADPTGLYVAGGDSKLYCLDLALGKIKWQYFASVPLRDSPEITADSVYQPVPGVGVVALDKSTGDFIRKPRWTVDTAKRFLAEDAQFAYLQGVDNSIIGVDKKTGEQKFRSQRSDLVAFASSPKGDTIYAATASGAVLGIKAVTQAGQVGQMVRAPLEFQAVAMAK